MQLHRAILSAFWLATVLLVAGWMLAPATAAAHPGHASGAHAGQMAAVAVSPLVTSLDAQAPSMPSLADRESPQAHYPTAAGTQPRVGEGCAGAACCTTGHGCCAAHLSAVAGPPAPSGSSRVTAIPAAGKQGFGTVALPEPPRPNR